MTPKRAKTIRRRTDQLETAFPGLVYGWQRIGDFLEVSERTARTWAAKFGLPIRRLPGGHVYGLEHELRKYLLLLDERRRRKNLENLVTGKGGAS